MDPENSLKSGASSQSDLPSYEDPWYSSSGGPESPISDYGYSNFNALKSTNSIPPPRTDSSDIDEDYSNEPPLLEELGIRFDHIWSKTQAVIIPNRSISEHILDDADLAGPIFFCLLLGACLLLSGKIHFGYIYGFSVCGCMGMCGVLNLLHPTGLDLWRTCSVLGYCLLPVIGLAGISILLSLKGPIGLSLALIAIIWSTVTSTRLFDAKLHLTEQFWLVAYPVALLYSCFVLITVF